MRGNNREKSSGLYKNKTDFVLQIMFLLCIGLAVWGLLIYRLTVIETKYLLIITTVGSFITFILIQKFLKTGYTGFWNFFVSIGIGGGLVYFGALFINQQFAAKEILSEQFEILKTGTLAKGRRSGCNQPYAVVDFYGTEKELIFYCKDAQIMRNARKVTVTYSMGALGFYVIKSKGLLE